MVAVTGAVGREKGTALFFSPPDPLSPNPSLLLTSSPTQERREDSLGHTTTLPPVLPAHTHTCPHHYHIATHTTTRSPPTTHTDLPPYHCHPAWAHTHFFCWTFPFPYFYVGFAFCYLLQLYLLPHLTVVDIYSSSPGGGRVAGVDAPYLLGSYRFDPTFPFLMPYLPPRFYLIYYPILEFFPLCPPTPTFPHPTHTWGRCVCQGCGVGMPT